MAPVVRLDPTTARVVPMRPRGLHWTRLGVAKRLVVPVALQSLHGPRARLVTLRTSLCVSTLACFYPLLSVRFSHHTLRFRARLCRFLLCSE